MTNAAFYRTVLLLYGDHWQGPLRALLKSHGIRCNSPQTFWNWKHGTHPIPDEAAEALLQEKEKRRR